MHKKYDWMEVSYTFSNERPFKPGDKVTTDFYEREAGKIRIVRECYRPTFNSQSGWFVITEDGLNADSDWFKRVRHTDEND